MLNRVTVNLTAVAFLTLLFAGCAVAPKTENLSMGTTAAQIRTGFPDDLQPNPSDSPEFTQWGAKKDLLAIAEMGCQEASPAHVSHCFLWRSSKASPAPSTISSQEPD
jgi:hypothetical protein